MMIFTKINFDIGGMPCVPKINVMEIMPHLPHSSALQNSNRFMHNNYNITLDDILISNDPAHPPHSLSSLCSENPV